MLGGEKKVRHDRRDERRKLDAQESRRRSRRKIAVADDTGQGKDVKNGAMPNECHLTRKTKDAEGDVTRDMGKGKNNIYICI